MSPPIVLCQWEDYFVGNSALIYLQLGVIIWKIPF